MAATVPKKNGRPITGTPELKAKIVESYGKCGSLKVCAELHGISRESIRLWGESDPSFLANLSRVRAAKAMGHVAALNARDETKVDTWWLARLYREDYSEKSMVELTGTNGGPVQVASLAAVVLGDPNVSVALSELLRTLGIAAGATRDDESRMLNVGGDSAHDGPVDPVPAPHSARRTAPTGSGRADQVPDISDAGAARKKPAGKRRVRNVAPGELSG